MFVLLSILCVQCFCIVLCIVSPHVYCCLFPILLFISYLCTISPTIATGWKPN